MPKCLSILLSILVSLLWCPIRPLVLLLLLLLLLLLVCLSFSPSLGRLSSRLFRLVRIPAFSCESRRLRCPCVQSFVGKQCSKRRVTFTRRGLVSQGPCYSCFRVCHNSVAPRILAPYQSSAGCGADKSAPNSLHAPVGVFSAAAAPRSAAALFSAAVAPCSAAALFSAAVVLWLHAQLRLCSQLLSAHILPTVHVLVNKGIRTRTVISSLVLVEDSTPPLIPQIMLQYQLLVLYPTG